MAYEVNIQFDDMGEEPEDRGEQEPKKKEPAKKGDQKKAKGRRSANREPAPEPEPSESPSPDVHKKEDVRPPEVPKSEDVVPPSVKPKDKPGDIQIDTGAETTPPPKGEGEEPEIDLSGGRDLSDDIRRIESTENLERLIRMQREAIERERKRARREADRKLAELRMRKRAEERQARLNVSIAKRRLTGQSYDIKETATTARVMLYVLAHSLRLPGYIGATLIDRFGLKKGEAALQKQMRQEKEALDIIAEEQRAAREQRYFEQEQKILEEREKVPPIPADQFGFPLSKKDIEEGREPVNYLISDDEGTRVIPKEEVHKYDPSFKPPRAEREQVTERRPKPSKTPSPAEQILKAMRKPGEEGESAARKAKEEPARRPIKETSEEELPRVVERPAEDAKETTVTNISLGVEREDLKEAAEEIIKAVIDEAGERVEKKEGDERPREKKESAESVPAEAPDKPKADHIDAGGAGGIPPRKTKRSGGDDRDDGDEEGAEAGAAGSLLASTMKAGNPYAMAIGAAIMGLEAYRRGVTAASEGVSRVSKDMFSGDFARAAKGHTSMIKAVVDPTGLEPITNTLKAIADVLVDVPEAMTSSMEKMIAFSPEMLAEKVDSQIELLQAQIEFQRETDKVGAMLVHAQTGVQKEMIELKAYFIKEFGPAIVGALKIIEKALDIWPTILDYVVSIFSYIQPIFAVFGAIKELLEYIASKEDVRGRENDAIKKEIDQFFSPEAFAKEAGPKIPGGR